MGSHGYKRLRRRKSVFVDASVGLGIYGNIQAKKLGQGVHEGPTRVGACPTPRARPLSLWLPRGSSDFISKSPGCLLVQEKSSRRFYYIWYSFSTKLKNKEKKESDTGH